MATLITGASSGIGEEFARRYAAQKQDLVLVARSQDKLNKLAEEFKSQHGIRVTVFALDYPSPMRLSGSGKKRTVRPVNVRQLRRISCSRRSGLSSATSPEVPNPALFDKYIKSLAQHGSFLPRAAQPLLAR